MDKNYEVLQWTDEMINTGKLLQYKRSTACGGVLLQEYNRVLGRNSISASSHHHAE